MIPRLASYYDRDYCAAATVKLLRDREGRYPALVNAGKLPAADAVAGLERARVIVAQWKWVMDPAGPIDPPWDEARGVYGFGAYDHELAADLAGAVTRARAIADRDPSNADRRELADLYAALAWWQQRPAGCASCRIVSETTAIRRIAARDRAAAERRLAA